VSESLLARNLQHSASIGARVRPRIAGNQIARVALYRARVPGCVGGGPAGISICCSRFTLPRLLGAARGRHRRPLGQQAADGCPAILAQALLFAALAWVRWWPAVIVSSLIATLFPRRRTLPAGRGKHPADRRPREPDQSQRSAGDRLEWGTCAWARRSAESCSRSCGPWLALIANAGTFVFSAALTLGIPSLAPRRGSELAPMPGGTGGPATLLSGRRGSASRSLAEPGGPLHRASCCCRAWASQALTTRRSSSWCARDFMPRADRMHGW